MLERFITFYISFTVASLRRSAEHVYSCHNTMRSERYPGEPNTKRLRQRIIPCDYDYGNHCGRSLHGDHYCFVPNSS